MARIRGWVKLDDCDTVRSSLSPHPPHRPHRGRRQRPQLPPALLAQSDVPQVQVDPFPSSPEAERIVACTAGAMALAIPLRPRLSHEPVRADLPGLSTAELRSPLVAS